MEQNKEIKVIAQDVDIFFCVISDCWYEFFLQEGRLGTRFCLDSILKFRYQLLFYLQRVKVL